MTSHKLLKEARSKIDESIDSIRAINGDTYAKTVVAFLMGMHLTKMIATYASNLPHIQAESLREQLLGTLSFIMELVVAGYGISDETEREMMEWAQQLCAHIDNAYTQIKKEEG